MSFNQANKFNPIRFLPVPDRDPSLGVPNMKKTNSIRRELDVNYSYPVESGVQKLYIEILKFNKRC